MIRGISPGDNYDVSRKNSAGITAVPEENTAPEPSDSARISLPPEKSAETMRKASIEHYTLHRKNRKEAAAKCLEASGNPSLPERTGAPRIITMLDNEPGIRLPGEDPGYDVSPFDQKLEKELGPLAKAQNVWDIEGLKGEIPTLSRLQESFDRIRTDKSVPWEYLVDGCYARAHVTCEKLLDEGLNCGKMYVIIGDDPNEPSGSFPSYRLRADGKFTRGEWWYHVAPLVFAKDEKTGAVDGYILDLAVNNKKPIRAADWINSCWSRDFPIQFDTTYADVYDPPEQNPFDGPGEFSRERFDKFLPEARDTNKEYSVVLAKIKKDYYAHHPDEKPDDRKRA